MFEQLHAVYDFVRENLEIGDLPFNLILPTGHKIDESENDKTLVDMRLVPAAILMFEWNPEYADAINAASNTILKPEVMMLLQSV